MDALLENDSRCCYHSTIIRYNSKVGVLSLVAFIVKDTVLTTFIYIFIVFEYLTLELIVCQTFVCNPFYHNMRVSTEHSKYYSH